MQKMGYVVCFSLHIWPARFYLTSVTFQKHLPPSHIAWNFPQDLNDRQFLWLLHFSLFVFKRWTGKLPVPSMGNWTTSRTGTPALTKLVLNMHWCDHIWGWERENYWEWPGLLPVAGNAAEKAQTSHSGEVMQMQCSQRPQELWKDLCKYLMHSCALRFMETKTAVTEPMPHLLVPSSFCFFSTEKL